MFKDSPLSSVFAGKGFSEVADWLRVQESLKGALAKQKDVKRLGGFSSHHGIKLARGPEHMAEERVHFSREFIFQREGEFKREEFLKEQLERDFKGVS